MHEQPETLYICAVCACQNIKYDLKLVTHKRAHQPDYFIYHSCKHLVRIHQLYLFHSDCVHVNVANAVKIQRSFWSL